jgi:hypothetical protein
MLDLANTVGLENIGTTSASILEREKAKPDQISLQYQISKLRHSWLVTICIMN